MSSRSRRPLTLVRALKAGRWEAATMANQLDEDLLPDCPFPGASARYVWENLRELQLAYQDRHAGWRNIPAQFERLARALPSVVALEAIAARPQASEMYSARAGGDQATGSPRAGGAFGAAPVAAAVSESGR